MSRVTVLFFGGLREALGCNSETIEVPAHAVLSFASLYRELCLRHPRLPTLMGSVRLALNEEFLPGIGDRVFEAQGALGDGDVVALIPPVTGG